MPRGIPGSGPNNEGMRATINPTAQPKRRKWAKKIKPQQGRLVNQPKTAASMIREMVNQRVDQIIAEALNQ